MQEKLIAIYSQHTANLNRVAAGLGNDVIPHLDFIYVEINKVFAKYSDRKRITKQLETQIRQEVSTITREKLQEYTRYLKTEQRMVGLHEADFSANQLNAVVVNENFESNIPAPAQITAAATGTPIKISENNYTTYNKMMSNYWQKWTDDIDAVVANGFIGGQPLSEIQSQVLSEIAPSKTGVSKTTLDQARRKARQIAITGMNHYANQARVAFGQDNKDVVKGYEFLAVLDNRTSRQCSSLDGKVFKPDDKNFSKFVPPLHPNCRSAMIYSVDERYTFKDDEGQRASRFRVDGKLNPKPVSSKETYYEAMNRLSAADQDAILGSTLGKAFRELDNPNDFAKFTIDSLGNPLTITEMKKRDNALSRILNNQ